MRSKLFYLALPAAAVISLCSIALTGCTSAVEAARERTDYTTSLNRYYEGRPLCVWQQTVSLPIANASPEQVRQLGLNALVDSGLLVRRHTGKGYTYDLTPEGRSAFSPDVFNHGAGNFCYGHRKVVSLQSARQNSSTTEVVEYQYQVPQPASWANEYPIRQAFPQISSELSGEHRAQATLLNTTEGWQVTGAPATVQPKEKAVRTSAVSRAKALFGFASPHSS